jgi:uncharacterized OsmC-like protein
MQIHARVEHRNDAHTAEVTTNGHAQSLPIPGRASGGSAVSGGELLFLALATCYCNDIYREAAQRGIEVAHVDVTVDGEFGGPGEAARGLTYRARVAAHADEAAIEALMHHTDGLAEIHNTLRRGAPVILVEAVVEPA